MGIKTMKASPSFLAISCLLILILYSTPQSLAARKLLQGGLNYGPFGGTFQMPPPPTPVHEVRYESETRNGAHAQIVSVNGQPRSQSGTVSGKNGTPYLQANNHTGSQTATINDPDHGNPMIKASNTTGSQTGIINGSNGKPQIEVHKYDNGTQSVTIYGSDGKPIFQTTGLPPPGYNGYIPPGYP